eukprot:1196278-Prorocentrum_minimum.AAC.5
MDAAASEGDVLTMVPSPLDPALSPPDPVPSPLHPVTSPLHPVPSPLNSVTSPLEPVPSHARHDGRGGLRG